MCVRPDNPYQSPETRSPAVRRKTRNLILIVVVIWASLLPLVYAGLCLLAELGGQMGD